MSPATLLVATAAAAITGILPDIDHPDASAAHGQVLPFQRKLGPLGHVIGLLISIPMRIIGVISRSFMGHRGGTHSLLFLAIWTVGAVPLYAFMFAVAAYFLSLLPGALIWGLIGAVAGLALAGRKKSGAGAKAVVGFAVGIAAATMIDVLPVIEITASGVWAWEREHLPASMPIVMLVVALGYLSHIFCDTLNTVPVPWLWPLRGKHAPFIPRGSKESDYIRWFFLPKGLRIRVESFTETHMVMPAVVILLGLCLLGNVAYPVAHRISNGWGPVDAIFRAEQPVNPRNLALGVHRTQAAALPAIRDDKLVTIDFPELDMRVDNGDGTMTIFSTTRKNTVIRVIRLAMP